MLFALRADVGSVLKFLANVRPVSPFSKLIKEKKTINQRQVTTLGLKSSWHTWAVRPKGKKCRYPRVIPHACNDSDRFYHFRLASTYCTGTIRKKTKRMFKYIRANS